MADSYYYQDPTGQIIGPLAPAALKKLANEGVVVEATPVRKGEQGAWYQAGTIAGLVPQRPAQAAPAEAFSEPGFDSGERARQTFRKAEEHADKVASTLWFLDLKFKQFFTPRLVGVVWLLYMFLLVFVFLGATVSALMTMNVIFAIFTIYVEFLALIFAAVFTRILLELCLVMFRIAEHLEQLKHLEHLKRP